MARPILHSPLCDLVGVEYPVVLAGMGPVAGGSVGPVATAELAAAVSNAGGLGVLGGSGHGPERLREEIAKLRSLTDKPFGVDLLLPANYMGPAATAKPPADPRELVPAEVTDGLKRMLADLGVPWVEAPPVPTATRPALRGEGGGMSDAQMEVVIEEKVPVFASGLGSPAHWLDRLHANSTVVFSLVGNSRTPSGWRRRALEAANKATAHMYIENPLKEHKSWLNSLFASHPDPEDRIRILRSM